MNAPDPVPPTCRQESSFLTFLIVAGSSLFFCSKGVIAKFAYAEGTDALTVLVLRMLFALPVFLITGIWSHRRSTSPLTPRLWAAMAGLGFFGYYLSSLVNFSGLQYISVGLERMVLYTYPTLVLVFSALSGRYRLRPSLLLVALTSYAGIVTAFFGEAHGRDENRSTLLLGMGLVFLSALTYAVFILFSGKVIAAVGSLRFTSIVVGFSCLFMLAHHGLTRPPGTLLHLPPRVYGCGVLLAVFGTVVPSFLLGSGLRRAGPQKFAIMGTVGPLGTLFLAWLVLGEQVNVLQAGGFLLSLGGGLAASLMKPTLSSR
ncbi:MAG: DMT family transporter [Verrucomicrobiales bacterium]